MMYIAKTGEIAEVMLKINGMCKRIILNKTLLSENILAGKDGIFIFCMRVYIREKCYKVLCRPLTLGIIKSTIIVSFSNTVNQTASSINIPSHFAKGFSQSQVHIFIMVLKICAKMV